jgi:hypothetical protein
MWTIARFDKTIRLAPTVVGVPQLVGADKAKQELGRTTRPARDSIVDTAESLPGRQRDPSHVAGKRN